MVPYVVQSLLGFAFEFFLIMKVKVVRVANNKYTCVQLLLRKMAKI